MLFNGFVGSRFGLRKWDCLLVIEKRSGWWIGTQPLDSTLKDQVSLYKSPLGNLFLLA